MARFRSAVGVMMCLLYAVCGGAQDISNYAFSTNTTGVFTNTTGSTQLIGPGITETASPVTNIGFDFFFVGQRYSQFSVNANGVIQLGPIVVPALGNGYNIDNRARIVPFATTAGAGAQMGTSPTGKVHYIVTGTAPDRVLTVEWLNMRIPSGAGGASDNSTFQARLYETAPGSTQPGRIEMLYGVMRCAQFILLGTYDYYTGIGHNDETTAYLGIDGDAATSTLGKTPPNTSAVVVAGSSFININTTNAAARRMFIYSNAANVPAAMPTALAAPCKSASSISLKWSGVITNESNYVIYRSTDNVNFGFLAQVSVAGNTYTDTGLSPSTTYFYRIYLITEGVLSALSPTAQLSATTAAPGTQIYPVASGNWSSTSIWSAGAIPTATSDVVMGCGGMFNVTVDADATINNLTMDAEALLTMTAGKKLTVQGSVSNGGTINNNANGEVIVKGHFTNTPAGNYLQGTAGTANLSFTGTNPQTLSHTGKSILSETVYSISGSSAIGDNNPLAAGNTLPTGAALTGCGACGKLTVAVPANSNNRIRSISVNIQHPNTDDLDVYLVAPNGTVMHVATDVGGTSDNFNNVTFSDATTSVLPDDDGAIAANSFYQLETGLLSSYAGALNGNWTLYVTDDAPLNAGGILTDFRISLWRDAPTSALYVRNLLLNNTSTTGVTLATPVIVTSQLTLTAGVLHTSATNSLTLENGTTSSPGNAISFVDGPMTKLGNTPDPFTYPLGNGTIWARLTTDYVDATATTATQFTAQYFDAPYPDLSNNGSFYNVSGNEYWILNRGGAAATQSAVQLYWQSGSRSGINDVVSSDLIVAKYNGTNWMSVGRTAISGTIAAGSVTSGNVTSFSPFTFGSIGRPSNPLPIKLEYFRAVLKGDKVLFEWKTTDERDNDFFTVERLTNADAGEKVLQVKSPGEGGHVYAAESRANTGRSYYRLKQTDYNGRSEYFGMELIDYEGVDTQYIKAYPSPGAGEKLWIEIAGLLSNSKTQLDIYTLQGTLIYSEEITVPATLFTKEVSFARPLAAGVYMVKAGAYKALVTRIIVQ